MPTSENATNGPLSDNEERKTYLELYSRGQDLLDQHWAQYESDKKFLDDERQKMNIMLIKQQTLGTRQLKRMGSNKTIKEESEISNTNTDLTPQRASNGISPQDPVLTKLPSSKIDQLLSDQESIMEAADDDRTDHEIQEQDSDCEEEEDSHLIYG